MNLTRRPHLLPAPANFSRDLRRTCALVSGVAALATVTALALSAIAFIESGSLKEAASLADTRAQRLADEIAAAQAEASDAPAMSVFIALRDRVDALNALDYGATPAVGGLLNALESTLPDDAILTNLDYDRNKGVADLVAVSTRSDELTRLFEVLDGHDLFSKVRLLDKKQIAAAGASQTQVNLVINVAAKAGEGDKAGGKP